MDENGWFTAGSIHAETRRKTDWNHFLVAEHVSVPEQRDPEVMRGMEPRRNAYASRHVKRSSRCVIPSNPPRSEKCELSDSHIPHSMVAEGVSVSSECIPSATHLDIHS